MRIAAALLAMLTIPPASDGQDADRPEAAIDLPLVFEADFEAGDTTGWTFTDPAAWTIGKVEDQRVLELNAASDYEPEVRSPLNIAWIEGLDLDDFVLDVDLRSTTPDYGHRDLCLFFGKQDASHFYYVHLGKEADPHAHSIFLVDGAPRVSIAQDRTDGTPWTDDWHHVRVVRKAESGLIAVYFDDMETPIMTSTDSTFEHGGLGVGSFDDTGQFDSIRIWGHRR